MFKRLGFRVVVVFTGLFFSLFFNTLLVRSADDKIEREKIKTEWLKAAEDVAQKINDKEAMKIVQFLEKNAVLAAPHKQGVVFLGNNKTEKWMLIIPLLKKDKDAYGERWRDIFSFSGAAAHFLPEARALVIKPSPYSSAGKAILLVHEGYHAVTFVKNPYSGDQNEKDYCYEEVSAHTLTNRVMSLLGGKKYQEVLNKEVSRIIDFTKKEGGRIGEVFPHSTTENDEILAIVFGKPDSQQEKDFIRTTVWLHAIFVVLDKNFQRDAEEKKALFLRKLYKESGIL